MAGLFPATAAIAFDHQGIDDRQILTQSADDNVYHRLEVIEEQLRRLTQPQASAGGLLESKADPGVLPDLDPAAIPANLNKEIAAEAKFPTFKITGFFQLDAGHYSQNAISLQTLGDIEDGLGFRRARLAAAGNVTERTSYIMEFDFAQAQGRFVDVWMQFSDTPLGNLRIGRFRQPFGMTDLTSVRELPLLERPTLFALSPFRQTGAMLFGTTWNERMTLAASGYRYLSDNFGNVYADSGGFGFSSRTTFLPIDCGDENLVHLGFDYSYNDPGRDQVLFASPNEFFISQNPNLGLASLSVLPIVGVPPFVITGLMPTQRFSALNLEAAISTGRFVVQSEARWAVIDDPSGGRNVFPGAYIHMRYMLTGETIPYNRKTALFARVKPHLPVDVRCRQFGGWELAARVSHIDLNGTGLPGPGRRLTAATLGLNWYVSEHTKFQFNWLYDDLNDPLLGDSNSDTLAWRGQIDF